MILPETRFTCPAQKPEAALAGGIGHAAWHGMVEYFSKHRTSNIEHRTPNTEHRTPNTEHRTPSTEDPPAALYVGCSMLATASPSTEAAGRACGVLCQLA